MRPTSCDIVVLSFSPAHVTPASLQANPPTMIAAARNVPPDPDALTPALTEIEGAWITLALRQLADRLPDNTALLPHLHSALAKLEVEQQVLHSSRVVAVLAHA